MKDESCHDGQHFLVPSNAVIAHAAPEASVAVAVAAAATNVVPQG